MADLCIDVDDARLMGDLKWQKKRFKEAKRYSDPFYEKWR
jgi:hypothetical protein